MENKIKSCDFENISLTKFRWLNPPSTWNLENETLTMRTNAKTDFWQETWYKMKHHSGHVYGIDIQDDFSLSICVQANFTSLYDQAGLMIIRDEKHWLKTGIEYNDGQPMISCVLTNGVSDWSTGTFTGDHRKFWIRLTKKDDVVCVKYSSDGEEWILLRLCPFPKSDNYFVGPMSCTPLSEGLDVKFCNLKITAPKEDILHSN